MDDFTYKLEQIQLKIRQLALKMERMEKTNASLLEENQQLKAVLNKDGSKVNDLEQRLRKTQEVLELKQANDPDKVQKVRKEIDRYIKEIDKCIEWLSAN